MRLVFINDLPSAIQALKKRFADDAKIYQVVTMADVAQSQGGIIHSEDWSEIWHIFFNFKKCKHMHIGLHDLNQT